MFFLPDVLQLWSQLDTAYTPTFIVSYGGLMGEEYWYDRTNVWENPRLLRYTPKSVLYPRSIRRPKAPDSEYNHIYVARAAKALRDAGVRVNIGAHGQREGLAAHWEIWSMVQGGFSPWEALRGATIDGAGSLGLNRCPEVVEVAPPEPLVVDAARVSDAVDGGITLRQVWKEILLDDCFGASAQLAYYFLLGFFPFLFFILVLVGSMPVSGLVERTVTYTMNLLAQVMPVPA